jgi:sugar phosphate permease
LKNISRTVWILSLKLVYGYGSEMLYPIMPIYLKSIGFSIVLIGILEGVAEATAGLSKGYFGKRSDDCEKSSICPTSYTFSAISNP